MKRIITAFILLLVVALAHNCKAQETKIGVISDLHYTHPSLIVEAGKALDQYLQQDRKLLLESDAILRKSVENLFQENVNIVLIPGDLTKDGELVSHQGVTKILQPLIEKGVKILVVPGNHDINNPDAVSFHGEETRDVPTVTAAQFKDIYANFGYADAISSDKNSLSYVSEPVEGLRVICIDACKYYDNTFVSRGAKRDSCVTNGAIKPETMRWIQNEAQTAKSLDKQVVAMMHHGVVEHFDYQSFFAAPYLVDNFEWVQQSFMESGINVVFTGHFHASDISKIEDQNGNFLYDIETGSIVTYPSPYRIIDFANNQLNINTLRIEEIHYPLPSANSFQAHAEKMIEIGFDEMVASLIDEYHGTLSSHLPKWLRRIVKFPDSERLTDMVLTNLSGSAVKMLVAHYGGNEHHVEEAYRNKEEILASIDNFVGEFCQESMGGFSGIAQNIVLRSSTVKRAKMAVSSIWENAILADFDHQKENIVLKNSIDDLNYLLTLQVKENRNNNSFYANIDESKSGEIKAKLFSTNPHKDEQVAQNVEREKERKEEKGDLSQNQYIILYRRDNMFTE